MHQSSTSSSSPAVTLRSSFSSRAKAASSSQAISGGRPRARQQPPPASTGRGCVRSCSRSPLSAVRRRSWLHSSRSSFSPLQLLDAALKIEDQFVTLVDLPHHLVDPLVRGRQIPLQALDLGGGFVRPSILTA